MFCLYKYMNAYINTTWAQWLLPSYSNMHKLTTQPCMSYILSRCMHVYIYAWVHT